MSRCLSKIIGYVFLLCLLSACSAKETAVKERFFFPPAPAQPKIEFIKAYFSDWAVKPEQKGFFVEHVLGETPPQPLFSTPSDVASNGKGRVFVADPGARQVVVLDLVNHKYRPLAGAEFGDGTVRGFGMPFSVTADANGRIYVVDVIAKRVDVFDHMENFLFSIEDSDFVRPTSVAVDVKNDKIFVLDTAAHKIFIFNLRGVLTGHFGERGDAPGEFNYPTDIDVDGAGNFYVLDSLNARIQVFDESGAFIREFGERGTAEGSFQVPKSLSVSNLGHVYATDALAHKMVVFSVEGELLLRIGGKSIAKGSVAPGGFYLPRGVDVDENNTIWVVDSLNKMVHRFQYLTPEYLSKNPVSQDVE